MDPMTMSTIEYIEFHGFVGLLSKTSSHRGDPALAIFATYTPPSPQ